MTSELAPILDYATPRHLKRRVGARIVAGFLGVALLFPTTLLFMFGLMGMISSISGLTVEIPTLGEVLWAVLGIFCCGVLGCLFGSAAFGLMHFAEWGSFRARR